MTRAANRHFVTFTPKGGGPFKLTLTMLGAFDLSRDLLIGRCWNSDASDTLVSEWIEPGTSVLVQPVPKDSL